MSTLGAEAFDSGLPFGLRRWIAEASRGARLKNKRESSGRFGRRFSGGCSGVSESPKARFRMEIFESTRHRTFGFRISEVPSARGDPPANENGFEGIEQIQIRTIYSNWIQIAVNDVQMISINTGLYMGRR